MRFKKIYIEITNACNLNCYFCSSAKRTKQFMSIAQFTHILDEIKPFCRYIYLHVLGEPLLHPSFEKLLATARQKGFYVNVTTNATLLSAHRNVIAKHVRQVNLSLHADLNGRFPDYLRDCLTNGDFLAKHGVYVSYRFWNHKQHRLDADSEQMLRQLLQHYHITAIEQKQQRLAERRYLHLEEQFTWPSMQLPLIAASGKCYGMRKQCAILCDGSVVPCCLDAQGECCLGNIYEESFAAILKKETVNDMVIGFQQGKLIAPLCQRCSYRTRFD